MDALNDEGLRADVRKAEQTIRAATGADPKPWFRCPFSAVMDAGRTPDELVTRVFEGVQSLEESVVLLHTWPAVTAEALSRLIARLTAERVEFIGVDELSGDAQRMPAR